MCIYVSEILDTFYLGNHNCAEYHQESKKDLPFDTLGKELDDKCDAEDIKKKWKELPRRFQQDQVKASVKPSGAGTADIYKAKGQP